MKNVREEDTDMRKRRWQARAKAQEDRAGDGGMRTVEPSSNHLPLTLHLPPAIRQAVGNLEYQAPAMAAAAEEDKMSPQQLRELY